MLFRMAHTILAVGRMALQNGKARRKSPICSVAATSSILEILIRSFVASREQPKVASTLPVGVVSSKRVEELAGAPALARRRLERLGLLQMSLSRPEHTRTLMVEAAQR